MKALCESLPDTEVETCPVPEEDSRPATWYPTASQRRGLSQLHELANVFDKVGDSKLSRAALLTGVWGQGADPNWNVQGTMIMSSPLPNRRGG